MAFALTVATTHTKTLLNPDSGSADKVYGSDYVSASSHTSSPTVSGGVAGGLLWTDSTTSISVSALLAANALVIGGGAGAAPFTDGTNLLYTTASGPVLQIGSGTTTLTGFKVGYDGSSGKAAIRRIDGTTVLQSTASFTYLNSPGVLWFTIADSTRAYLDSVAGSGMYVTAGTAATDVAAFSVTRTNNDAAVATGVKFAFTDTTSAAGFLPFQVLGGASATTNLLSLSKVGLATVNSITTTGDVTNAFAGSITANRGGGNISTIVAQANGLTGVFLYSGDSSGTKPMVGFADPTVGTTNANISWLSSGLIGVGTGAAGSIAGGIQLASIGLSSGHIADSATAPSIASGFGTSPSISANNGTAAFTLTIGTATTGVTGGTITMPAATTGWVCHCENVTTPDSFIVSQTGGTTTTIVLKNYSRTTGLATDFTASDVIRIFARGY